MATLIFFFLIFIYLVVGRIVVLLMTYAGKLNPNSGDYGLESFFCNIAFPVVLFFYFLSYLVNLVATAIVSIFTNPKDDGREA